MLTNKANIYAGISPANTQNMYQSSKPYFSIDNKSHKPT